MPDAALSYTTSEGSEPGTTILKLSGPLTLGNIFSFQQEFRRLDAPVLIIDLADVNYMDSAGLGLLMNAYVSAQSHGRKLLVAEVNSRVAALLEMTKCDAILKCYPSVSAAEADA